jgi:transposase InsO family protein
LCLQELKTKHSITILREIVKTVKHYGFPKKIRSDNEHCFTSGLLKLSLKLLSIKKQTTDIACPWQNSRIERCFGTFKQKWRQITFDPYYQLQIQLNIYQTWYNMIRPHSNLDGRTPAEVFNNKQPHGKAKFVTAWDGVLSGYYFPD